MDNGAKPVAIVPKIASPLTHQTEANAYGLRSEKGSSAEPVGSSPQAPASRPSRNKERISYSDFYKLGMDKAISSSTLPKATPPPEKRKSAVMKFKVKPVTRVEDDHRNSSMTNGRSLSQDKGNPQAAKEVLCLSSSTDQAPRDQAPSLPMQESVHDKPQSSRERVMTSPLSSVPSDLGEEEEEKFSTDAAQLGKKSSANPRPRTQVSNGRISENGLVGGQKRPAPSSDNGKGEKGTKKNKKIKISSPAKQRFSSPVELGVLPQELKLKPKSEGDSRSRMREDDQTSNDGHCSACSGTGRLLCCDDCPRSFHFTCIEPPIEEADIPDEPYFCMSCWDKRYGFPRPAPGLFHDLLDAEVTRDPVMYQLPEFIRTFFENGENGVYQDSHDRKFLRKDRNGFAEELDPHRLRDRHNRPVLCYKCGRSALNSSGIVSCDHCTAHWHFDCVSPPLHGQPPLHKKWMCPLHASDVTPSSRIPKQARTLDVSLHREFQNDGNIEIALSEEHEEVTPDSDSESGSDSDYDSNIGQPRLKYRLPEKGIILDFLDTCHRDYDGQRDGSAALDAIMPDPPGPALAMLLDIAMAETKHSLRPQTSLDQEERVQLLALRALLCVKGKQKVLEFLQSK